MKKVIAIIALAVCTLSATAQKSPFDSFENDENVSSVVVTKNMFKLLSKMDLEADDPEVKEYLKMIDNLENIKVYTTENSSVATKMSNTVKDYISSNKSLSELMRVTDEGKNIKFYSKEGKNENFVSELLMFFEGNVDGQKRTVVMSITGNIDLKQVSKLTKDLDVPGSDELKNVKSNKK